MTAKKKAARKALRAGILYAALLLMGLLLIPVCLFLLPVMAIWSLADRLLRHLE